MPTPSPAAIRYRFVAEATSGATIAEAQVTASCQREAYDKFWSGLTDEQRNACACVECLDEVAS